MCGRVFCRFLDISTIFVFVVHCAENGSLVNLLVYSFCQGDVREFGLVERPIINILVGAFWL